MCGICAFFDPELKDKDCAIQGMMDTIKHRGPSSDGKYTNDKVALGFLDVCQLLTFVVEVNQFLMKIKVCSKYFNVKFIILNH